MKSAMSAIGTKRTCACAAHMSAIGGKADMPFRTANVRYWSNSGHDFSIAKCSLMTQQRGRTPFVPNHRGADPRCATINVMRV
jgi:hypothetical protein